MDSINFFQFYQALALDTDLRTDLARLYAGLLQDEQLQTRQAAIENVEGKLMVL